MHGNGCLRAVCTYRLRHFILLFRPIDPALRYDQLTFPLLAPSCALRSLLLDLLARLYIHAAGWQSLSSVIRSHTVFELPGTTLRVQEPQLRALVSVCHCLGVCRIHPTQRHSWGRCGCKRRPCRLRVSFEMISGSPSTLCHSQYLDCTLS